MKCVILVHFNFIFVVLSSSSARYLATARGGRLLLYEGNTYFVNSRRRSRARVLWYCSSRKSRQCPASVFTMHDRVLVLGQEPVHTHPPKVSTYANYAAEQAY